MKFMKIVCVIALVLSTVIATPLGIYAGSGSGQAFAAQEEIGGATAAATKLLEASKEGGSSGALDAADETLKEGMDWLLDKIKDSKVEKIVIWFIGAKTWQKGVSMFTALAGSVATMALAIFIAKHGFKGLMTLFNIKAKREGVNYSQKWLNDYRVPRIDLDAAFYSLREFARNYDFRGERIARYAQLPERIRVEMDPSSEAEGPERERIFRMLALLELDPYFLHALERQLYAVSILDATEVILNRVTEAAEKDLLPTLECNWWLRRKYRQFGVNTPPSKFWLLFIFWWEKNFFFRLGLQYLYRGIFMKFLMWVDDQYAYYRHNKLLGSMSSLYLSAVIEQNCQGNVIIDTTEVKKAFEEGTLVNPVDRLLGELQQKQPDMEKEVWHLFKTFWNDSLFLYIPWRYIRYLKGPKGYRELFESLLERHQGNSPKTQPWIPAVVLTGATLWWFWPSLMGLF